MSDKYIERCSTSLIIKEMQIKTTVSHLTPISMTIIKNTRGEAVEKRQQHSWRECKLVCLLWKTVWGVYRKIKNRTII